MIGSDVLSVRGLHAGYGGIRALTGVDLEVARGEVVALVGRNGAGKSTLINAIVGVVPAEDGELIFEGEPIHGLPTERRIGKGISWIPEGGGIFGPLTVEENLRIGAYTLPRDRLAVQMAHVFELFPILAERRRQSAGNLSGGEQQMLAVARALMADPKLILLDEPSLGLAPLLVSQVFGHLRTLSEQGVAVLVSEQNARAALRSADRAYVLRLGEVVTHGDAAALNEGDELVAAYL